jgi:hypothetical protein
MLKRTRVSGFAIGLLLSSVCMASSPQEWSHKDWRVEVSGSRCLMRAGGDGEDYLLVGFDKDGYNAAFTYEPLIMRGAPVALSKTDEIILFVDGQENWLGEEMFVSEGENEYGEYSIVASLTSGFVYELTMLLRKSGSLEVRKRQADGAVSTLATFSLAGFAATYLKAAEWCKFNPDQLPMS